MDHSDFIVYSFMENSIGPKKVNAVFIFKYFHETHLFSILCKPSAEQIKLPTWPSGRSSLQQDDLSELWCTLHTGLQKHCKYIKKLNIKPENHKFLKHSCDTRHKNQDLNIRVYYVKNNLRSSFKKTLQWSSSKYNDFWVAKFLHCIFSVP